MRTQSVSRIALLAWQERSGPVASMMGCGLGLERDGAAMRGLFW